MHFQCESGVFLAFSMFDTLFDNRGLRRLLYEFCSYNIGYNLRGSKIDLVVWQLFVEYLEKVHSAVYRIHVNPRLGMGIDVANQ
jgi:hypothetical protein